MMEQYITLTITKKMYGWSKWGGAREGMLKEELDEWYCQACGEKQIQVLPSYMFPLDDTERDYVRICTMCKAKAMIKHARVWSQLLSLIK